MELKKYKLGDVADIVNGATPSTHNSENYDGSIIWITPKDLSGQKQKIIRRGQRNISEIGFNNCSAQMIPPYNILMSSRAPIGLLAINENECCTNQGFKNLVLDKSICDTDYMYYYLQFHMKEIEALGSGTTFKEISKSALQGIEIRLPDLEKQRDIAKCLSDLDRKIELNKQINDNLEAMAKQLYDYWFVQFDFPNEEGKPYKSSGGAMVWNEKLKREIPQGLDTPKIGDIEKNIITGKTPSCADEDNFGGDIPFVTIDDIRGNLFVFEAQRTLSTKGADSQEKKYLPIGSLSVSCIGTIGIMGFVARLAQTNQQINSIVFEHEYNKEFLYFSLKLYFENAKAKTGNVFANMSKEEFASIIVAYPPKQILQAFHNKVAPIFDSIKNNIEEINSLTKQRDELLPLLMNGQATVNSD